MSFFTFGRRNPSLKISAAVDIPDQREKPMVVARLMKPHRSPLGRFLVNEFEITWRMLIDSLLASFIPGVTFATAVCLRNKLTGRETAVTLGKATIISILFTYVFDSANQAHGGKEDMINKPHRPIPSGLLTAAGAMRRFWASMLAYTLVGWGFAILEWVVLWQSATVIISFWCPPYHRIWAKTASMIAGVAAQLAAAWQLVTPIDAIGTRWIVLLATIFPAALIFEDVRDMPGDRADGRCTPALVLGPWPVRIWFASILTAIPVLVHFVLFIQTAADPWRIALCDISLTTVSWTAAIRALAMTTVKADRYHLPNV